MSFVVSVFLKYLESHPDQVEKLIDALVTALINHFSSPAK